MYWNDGYYFSSCAACGTAIIKGQSRWRPVPRGYRIVWHKRRSGDFGYKVAKADKANAGLLKTGMPGDPLGGTAFPASGEDRSA